VKFKIASGHVLIKKVELFDEKKVIKQSRLTILWECSRCNLINEENVPNQLGGANGIHNNIFGNPRKLSEKSR
jgi:hypothetical protein